ncbi:hypothetical protein BBK14_11420 [Parafrankia soli]|uniref:Uncharacterized protein n=1 Tax=Parafrankia soli TaxID=2599596 RepID=A0A1S1R5K7_9ACTN|nr:hypothetical protein [Parafrankia soli]OHV42223.1 hypothetical protein BBK14_11420 [Parafrankia soli]
MTEPITDPIDVAEVAHLVDDAAQHQPDRDGVECRHCGAVWPCTKGGLHLALEQARAERDRLIATRADAVRLLPVLRAQVDAGAAAHPELGPFTDEDVTAMVIVAASDVRHLLDREKERTARLRAALERTRDQKRATPEENLAWSEEPELSCCDECDAVEIAVGALAATDPAAGQ